MQGIVEWIEFPAHWGNILRKNNNRYLPRFYLASFCPVPRERRETLIKNIVLPFDYRWSSASFRRCWFVLYDIVTHPVPDYAFYPLTSQNQHDCKQTWIHIICNHFLFHFGHIRIWLFNVVVLFFVTQNHVLFFYWYDEYLFGYTNFCKNSLNGTSRKCLIFCIIR